MRRSLPLAACASLLPACSSPGAVQQPTRTPRAGTMAVAVAVEETLARPDPARGTGLESTLREAAGWGPRVRAGLHYGLSDRIAIGVQGNLVFGLQGMLTWNVLRSRFVDVSLRAGGGYEQCWLLTARYCRQDPLPDFVGHGAALLSLGINPTERATVQLTAGPMVQVGHRARALVWAEVDAWFFVTPTVGLGPSLLALPAWYPDGRWVLAPALSLVVYPGRSNPY